MNFTEELEVLRRQVKGKEKEIRRLKEENEFLEEASAFLPPTIGSLQKAENEVACHKNWERHYKGEGFNSIIQTIKRQVPKTFIDDYVDLIVEKGTVLYRGEPNGTEYFTTLDAIEQSGRDATKLFEGLQVYKDPIYGYREKCKVIYLMRTLQVHME